MKQSMLLTFFCLFSIVLMAEEESKPKKKALRKDAINVYMEAADDYMKQEVPFVNYVRDIQDADLVILGTGQSTGSGGAEFIFFVEGRKHFAGVKDTVKFNTYPHETHEEARKKGVRTMKMGLMKYMINTPLADFIDIQFTEPIEEEVSTDNWNSWVFTVGLNTSLRGNETVNQRLGRPYLSANKTTDKWRIGMGVDYNKTVTDFDYDGYSTTDEKESGRVYGDLVRSLGDHWGLGVSSDLFQSIYSNYDLGFVIGPGVEYNIFPYSESSKRILRFNYTFMYGYSDYSDTTAFVKTEESLFKHSLNASYTNFQNWGTINFIAKWSNYLHDFNLNRVTLGAYVDIKIAKGLKFNLSAGYAFIHDQVSLRKGSVSIEDILLGSKELFTSYSYTSSVGITYRFGSIYDNVVNRRLDLFFE